MHVILILDTSKSMKKNDVRNADGAYTSRISAALDSCAIMITEQLADNNSKGDVYSLVTYNDTAVVRISCDAISQTLLRKVRQLGPACVPRGGTVYREGMATARWLAEHNSSAHPEVYMVFLSDGRPVDLDWRAKKAQPPIVEARNLKARFGAKFHFKAIALGGDDFAPLELLAEAAGGTVMHSKLETDTTTSARAGGALTRFAGTHTTTTAAAAGGRATAVIPQSMSDVFRHISSDVSSMNDSFVKGQEVAVQLLPPHLCKRPEFSLYAEEFMLSSSTKEFVKVVPRGRVDTIVSIHPQPFAQGGVRNCYRMWKWNAAESEFEDIVGKESRFEVNATDHLGKEFHRTAMQSANKAREYTTSFNRSLLRAVIEGDWDGSQDARDLVRAKNALQLEVISCSLYKIKDSTAHKQRRYMLVEPFLRGTYVKYNGNNGYVSPRPPASKKCQRGWWDIAQAFSHYTYVMSGETLVACDLQGVDGRLTDIAISSTAKAYGSSDMGAAGIQNFKNKHVCNGVCHALDLEPCSSASRTTVIHALSGITRSSARVHTSGFAVVIEAEEDEYDSDYSY